STSKNDSLLDEFAGELPLLKSIPPRINETDCDPEEEIRFIKRLLYDNSSPRPLEEFISENSDTAFEYFFPSPIPVEDSDSFMEEIDLSFTPGDLINDSLSIPKNESFHFDIPSFYRPPAKPPDGNSGILNVKMMGDSSEHKEHSCLGCSIVPLLSPLKLKYGGNWVKLSDPKQALCGRHPMLILSLVMNNLCLLCVIVV
nr:hypothetical protein [Tanacetum cinerariifolium]